MLHRLMENGVDMVVRQGVDDGLAVALEFHQVRLLELAQLVRHG